MAYITIRMKASYSILQYDNIMSSVFHTARTWLQAPHRTLWIESVMAHRVILTSITWIRIAVVSSTLQVVWLHGKKERDRERAEPEATLYSHWQANGYIHKTGCYVDEPMARSWMLTSIQARCEFDWHKVQYDWMCDSICHMFAWKSMKISSSNVLRSRTVSVQTASVRESARCSLKTRLMRTSK